MNKVDDKEILEVIKIKRYLRVQIEECKDSIDKIKNGVMKGNIKELTIRIKIYRELLKKFDATDMLNTSLKSTLQLMPTKLFK